MNVSAKQAAALCMCVGCADRADNPFCNGNPSADRADPFCNGNLSFTRFQCSGYSGAGCTSSTVYALGLGSNQRFACSQEMICQRCSAGSCDHEGIPRSSLPLRSSQNRAPGGASLTFGLRIPGVRPLPFPVFPWQAEQYRSYNFPPAATASGLLASGFAMFAIFE